MTALAPYISSFLREHLPKERRASLHTCEAYALASRLLVGFAGEPARSPTMSARDRAARRTADPCLPRRHRGKPRKLGPVHAMLGCRDQCLLPLSWSTACRRVSIRRSRIHAIPMKKTDEALVDYLDPERAPARSSMRPNREPSRDSGPSDASPCIRGRAACLRTCRIPSRSARAAGVSPRAGEGTA